MSPATLDETTPLVTESAAVGPVVDPSADGLPKDAPAHSRRFWLVIPVVFGSCLATAMPTTTTLSIIRLILCRRWYDTHFPGSLPRGRLPSEEMCSNPEIVTSYTMAVTLMGIVESIGALVAFGTINICVKKYGRKPVFMGLTITAGLAFVLFLLALDTASYLSLIFMSLAIVCVGLGGVGGVILDGRMFIVDTTTPIQRTAALSLQGAASLLGLTPSFALGGLITTYCNDVRAVYLVSLLLHITVFMYELFVLPESYIPSERKEALAEMEHTIEQSRERGPSRPGPLTALTRMVFHPLIVLFEPLVALAPRIEETGRRDFHLFLAAFASFLWYLSAHYIGLALMLRLTTEFHLPPDQNGFAMSLLLGSKAVFMTLFLPLVIKYGRLWYARHVDATAASRAQEVAKRFDSYIVMVSYVVDAVFVMCIGLARTKVGIFIAVIFLGFGSGGHPALNSVLVASVPHNQSDEILSAVAMVESVGQVLSPIVLGAIMSATINTFPAAAFLVSGSMALLAAVAFWTFKRLDRKRRKSGEW